MATDHADEIAAEALRLAFAAMHEATGWMGDIEDENYRAALPVIAAAFRSYGDEKLEQAAMALGRQPLDFSVNESINVVRSLKTSPTQEIADA